MKFVDQKLKTLKAQTSELALKCHDIGEHKTHQLLLEVIELLDVTHDAFLGKALKNVVNPTIKERKDH